MKKKITLIFSTLALAILLLFSFVEDNNPFLEALNKIIAYNKSYPQEKIYIQLDKPYYSVGDDIWLKAYVVNTATNSPSEISKILYTELISEKDSIIKRLTLPLSTGISWGDFAIPDSLPDGNYRIRAYTNWMRNFNEDFFFNKTIKIGNLSENTIFTSTKYIINQNPKNVLAKITVTNKDKAPYSNTEFNFTLVQSGTPDKKGKTKSNSNGEIEIPFDINNSLDKVYGRIEISLNTPNSKKITKIIPINITDNSIDLQFLPEGGNLIENLPSRIAVKAINSLGKGIDVSVKIKDQSGEQIEEVKTEHLGMGAFTINPQPGVSYYAELKLKDGTIKKIDLPKALNSGYTISANSSNAGKLAVKIMLSEDLVNKGDLNLLAQHGNKIYYSAKTSSSNQIISLSIPKADIPSGILTLTLFNPKNEPICERLVFINNTKNRITLNQEKIISTAKRKEKVNLLLKATNDGKAVQGSFSVAINNISKIDLDEMNESNILTSLLLTSDLSGQIENPNYYFNGDSINNAKLDLLLLTQGWKRYILKDIIENKQIPITYQPELGLSIEGYITKKQKPSAKTPVYLFASAGKNFAIDTLSDENGKFIFNNLFFNDSTHFMIKAGNIKGSDYNIKLLTNVPHVINFNKNKSLIELNVNDAILNYLKKNENYINEMTRLGFLKKPIELNSVEIKADRKKIVETTNFNGSGNADEVFTADDLKNTFTLRQYLEGRVSGIRFEGSVDTPILIRNSPPERMKIIVDGLESTEEDALNSIPITSIASIEVLKSIQYTFAYGTRAGVILITTKLGSNTSDNNIKPKSIVTFKPSGYYFSRQFYMPKYGSLEQEKDYRTTIFWKPNIVSDKDGNINIEYLNANEIGKYRVIIEGIDSYGNLARKTVTYNVE